MKLNLRILIILIALGVIFTSASDSFAQTQNMPSVGDYKPVSVKDKQIIEAAEFAVAKQAEKSEINIELVSIESAETQVAVGTNYRLCMQITAFTDEENLEEGEEAEEVTGFAKIVIFRNLKGEFSLTSWIVVENCGTRKAKVKSKTAS